MHEPKKPAAPQPSPAAAKSAEVQASPAASHVIPSKTRDLLLSSSSAPSDASPGATSQVQNASASERGERGAMSRREFARRAALTALAPAALSSAAAATPAAATPAVAQTPAAQAPAPAAKPPVAAPAATPAPAEANLPKLTAEGQAEADARVQSILGQYGARLSDEQKADVRRLCAWAQPPLDRLRAYHLQNADGGALYLKPLVEREKKPAPPAAKPAAKKKDS